MYTCIYIYIYIQYASRITAALLFYTLALQFMTAFPKSFEEVLGKSWMSFEDLRSVLGDVESVLRCPWRVFF